MEISKIIAGNLTALRTERNLSITALAQICGISKAVLSDMEKGESNPTINTLLKIAGGLGVPYTSLTDYQDNKPELVKEADGKIVSQDKNHKGVCLFSATAKRNFSLCNFTLEAGGEITQKPQSKTHHYILATKGEISISNGDFSFTLAKSDAIKIDASKKYTIKNNKNKTSTFTLTTFVEI